MKVNILLLFVLLNSNFAEELRNLTEHAILTKEYLNNPSKFLVNHSNEENFIAVFSNFTNSNGRELYNSYMQDVYLKDIQTILDDINNVKRGYGSKWKFDPVRKKYILPDKSKMFLHS